MKKSIWITASIIMLVLSTATAEETLKGKDIVSNGTVQTLSGKLRRDGDEWQLVANGKTYEIHLGPSEYRQSENFTMTEGEPAEVKGFVFKEHLSPIAIKMDSGSITLRDEAGKSVWAGTEFSGKKGK
jgi:hypothetical protein